MTINIRLAQPDDAAALSHVTVDTFLIAHKGQIPEAAWQKRQTEWTYAESESGWRRTLDEIVAGKDTDTCVYVAVAENDEIVGLVVGVPTDSAAQTVEISSIYVRQSHHGLGIGRRLIAAIAADSVGKGKQALEIGVLAANLPARGFYEALGGRVIREEEIDEEGFMVPAVVYGWPDLKTLT